MERRACIIEVANDLLEIVKQRLPPGVEIVAAVQCFDFAKTALKLAGLGLPDSCKEPPNGGPIVRMLGGIPFTGPIVLTPVVPVVVPEYKWDYGSYGKHLN